MRGVRFGGALLVVVVAAGGCGARVTPRPAVVAPTEDITMGGTTPAPGASPTDVAPPVNAPATAPASAPPTEASQPPPEPAASPDYGPNHNNGELRITLSATCVRPGDILVVDVQGPPSRGLAMVASFSDRQPHGAMMVGETDAAGRASWQVPIAPSVPDGPAKVLASVSGQGDQGQPSSADAPFRVARGGC